MMANCKTDIGDLELAEIIRVLPNLVKKIERQGELFEHNMDAAGIRNNVDSFKDGLPMCRRRSVILTNNEVIQRECRKRDAKAADLVVAAEKRVEKAAKKVQTAAVKAAKVAAKAAKVAADVARAAAGANVANAVVRFEDIANYEVFEEGMVEMEDMEEIEEEEDEEDEKEEEKE